MHTLSPVESDSAARADAILSTLTLRDKIGLMFHAPAIAGAVDEPNDLFSLPSIRTLIERHRITHFNVVGSTRTAAEFALWHNEVQRIAAAAEIPIPVTFASDPRHAFSDNPATAAMSGPFSQWPEPLGLGAIGSAAEVERFADIVRQEYRAVGIRVALHPQIDLATEPRWARANHTFGEDVTLTSRLCAAYIKGLQGSTLGTDSVAAMAKHFPGGGPQQDGEDAHFPYGREQIYPGGQFQQHLRPFLTAIEAGVSQLMPYYGMPIGTEYEEVGFGFNKSVITGLLRERLGFTGIVCSDWGLITDLEVMGELMPARAWGVEHLSRIERLQKILDAGVDQIGGEVCTDLLTELHDTGAITEARIDVSAERLLREKVRLGLFDQPLVDTPLAEATVGRRDFMRAGLDAQSAAITVLDHGGELPELPLRPGLRVFIDGVDARAVGERAQVVATPLEADVAIVRVAAPYEKRDRGVEAYFHAGSLEFDFEELVRLVGIAREVPTIIDVFLDRPAVLTPLVGKATLVADFGASDDALMAALFGEATPRGTLPFDLPRSDDAVVASRPDVAFDTLDPLFRCGHGLIT